MAAYRCPDCSISYPGPRQDCAACGRKLDWHPYAAPDPDWQQQADEILRARELPDGEEIRLEMWRLAQLLGLGVEQEDAERLARMRGFDWHRIEQLVRAGATPAQAVRIIG